MTLHCLLYRTTESYLGLGVISLYVVSANHLLTLTAILALSRDVEAVIFQTLPLPHLSLPLPLTKSEKTTVGNFFKLL